MESFLFRAALHSYFGRKTMPLKVYTFCLTLVLGAVAGILLDRTEPSVAEQLACSEAGGISLISSKGAPLCIRQDALINPHSSRSVTRSILSSSQI